MAPKGKISTAEHSDEGGKGCEGKRRPNNLMKIKWCTVTQIRWKIIYYWERNCRIK